MSMLWADDFSTYGIGGQARLLDGNYAEITAGGGSPTLAADPDPSSPGNAVIFIPSGAVTPPTFYSSLSSVRKSLSADKATIGGSVRIWMTSLPANNASAPFIRLADSTNTGNIVMTFSTIGQIIVNRGDMFSTAGRTVLGTTAGLVTASAWNHIEWKIFCHASTGTVDVWLNGVSLLSLTGQNTLASGTGVANVSVGCGNNANVGAWPATYFRDEIIWDSSGTVNNSQMGTCFVDRYTVDADVSFNWTASTGTTGYNLINEKGPNDANYISASATPPAASTFSLQDLPTNATTIRGIMLMGRMQKSDGGDCNVQMALNDGTSDTNGSNRPITTAFTYWSDVLELNTTTGAAWTRTQFNGAKFKVNRTV